MDKQNVTHTLSLSHTQTHTHTPCHCYPPSLSPRNSGGLLLGSARQPKQFSTANITTLNEERGFPGGSVIKNLPAKQETWVQSSDQGDHLEKEETTHSNILAWEIPWTEEPGGLQSIGLQRVGHDWWNNNKWRKRRWTPLFVALHTLGGEVHPAWTRTGLSGWVLYRHVHDAFHSPWVMASFQLEQRSFFMEEL